MTSKEARKNNHAVAKKHKSNSAQFELPLSKTTEIDPDHKDKLDRNVIEKTSTATFTIKQILNAIDPIGYYPKAQQMLEEIAADLENFSRVRGADPWAKNQLTAIRKEIITYEFKTPIKAKKKDVGRPQFDLAESFRVKTPEDCLFLVLFKVCLLKALLFKTHPNYRCERLARQIRLSCRDKDSRRGLVETQNLIFEDPAADCHAVLFLMSQIAGEERGDNSALHRRHVAFFTAIEGFFQEPQRGKESKGFDSGLNTLDITVDSVKFERLKLKLCRLTADGISKFNDGQTFRWLQNTLTRKPFSTVRFNALERHELIAHLNDLGASDSPTDRWMAVVMTLMYSCGKTVREVNQLTFGKNMDLGNDDCILRRLKRPLDAGIVAAPELCEPQSDEIRLPLSELASRLINEMYVEQRPLFALIPMTIAEQTAKIKNLLKDWRKFGRYRLSMPRLSAALSTELAVKTQHPSLIYLLSCKDNHAAPTSGYYTAVSHKQLHEVWAGIQSALYSYE